jgi:hypothetical protein
LSRKAWIIFLSLQAAGIIFSLVSKYTLGPSPLISGIGVGLLVSGNLLLFPGSLVGLIVTQKVLFHSGLSVDSLSLLGILVAVAANLVIWLVWAKLYRSA